jgi:hypothetical protein
VLLPPCPPPALLPPSSGRCTLLSIPPRQRTLTLFICPAGVHCVHGSNAQGTPPPTGALIVWPPLSTRLLRTRLVVMVLVVRFRWWLFRLLLPPCPPPPQLDQYFRRSTLHIIPPRHLTLTLFICPAGVQCVHGSNAQGTPPPTVALIVWPPLSTRHLF